MADSGWNLPPGCFTSDLPGCSADDEHYGRVRDEIEGLDVDEIFNKYYDHDSDWVDETIYEVFSENFQDYDEDDLPIDYESMEKFCKDNNFKLDDYIEKVGKKLKDEPVVIDNLSEKQFENEKDPTYWIDC